MKMRMDEDWHYDRLKSPLGVVILLESDGVLRQLNVGQAREPRLIGEQARARHGSRLLSGVKEQLLGYFAGTLERFDLPLGPRGTPFQQRVWAELAKIPYGKTKSYGEVATALAAPGAARAVGQANRCNPIPIIIPCHRVIAADGALGGFSGGLDRKRFLLALEVGATSVAPVTRRRRSDR